MDSFTFEAAVEVFVNVRSLCFNAVCPGTFQGTACSAFPWTVHFSHHGLVAVTYRENASYLIGPVLLLISRFLVLSYSII